MEGSVVVARIKRAAECLVAIRSQLTFYEESIRQKRQPSFIGLPVFSPLLLIVQGLTERFGYVEIRGINQRDVRSVLSSLTSLAKQKVSQWLVR